MYICIFLPAGEGASMTYNISVISFINPNSTADECEVIAREDSNTMYNITGKWYVNADVYFMPYKYIV